MRSALALPLLLFVCRVAAAQHFHHHLEAAPEDELRVSPCVKPYATPPLNPDLHQYPITNDQVLW